MIKMDNAPTLYTIEEATAIVPLGYQTIRKLILNGTLDGHKVGRTWYVSEDSLRELALGKTAGSSVVSSKSEAPKG